MSNFSSIGSSRTPDVRPRLLNEVTDKSKNWKLTEITDSGQCRSLRFPDTMDASKVVRLIYTNFGVALLALTSNAVNKLWKWQRSDRNPSGKSTASIPPQMWQPASGIVMNNDPEEAAVCIALSKNDSYVMSAAGGNVSLFNMMMAFKVKTKLKDHQKKITDLAFGIFWR